MLAEPASKSPRIRSDHWTNALDTATLQLPRTAECFGLIESEPRLEYRLPRRLNTSGAKLRHCYEVMDKTLNRFQPCIFKIGITHCAHFRFFNDVFGYVHEKHDKWERMVVIFASNEAVGPSFIEAALIQRHKGFLFHLCLFFVYLYIVVLSFIGIKCIRTKTIGVLSRLVVCPLA